MLFVRTAHLRTSIRYPVCGRHLWIARIAGTISARNLFNLTLGVLWVFPAMGLALVAYGWLFNATPIKAPDAALISVIVAVGIAVFMFGRLFTPVKLTEATEEVVTLSIRNDAYAHEFESLNASVVLPTHPKRRLRRS